MPDKSLMPEQSILVVTQTVFDDARTGLGILKQGNPAALTLKHIHAIETMVDAAPHNTDESASMGLARGVKATTKGELAAACMHHDLEQTVRKSLADTERKEQFQRTYSAFRNILKDDILFDRDEMAERLDIQPEVVNQKRSKGHIFGVKIGQNPIAFPAWQTNETGGMIDGFRKALTLLKDNGLTDIEIYFFFKTTFPEMGTPIDGLKSSNPYVKEHVFALAAMQNHSVNS